MQPVDQMAGVSADQPQLDLGMGLSKGGDQGQREDVGHRRRKPDGDPALQGRVEVGGGGTDLLQFGHDACRMLEDLASLFRQDHAATVPGEQPDRQLLFQHPDLSAERGLGDADPIGRLAQAAEVGDVDQGAKLGKLHGSHTI